MGAMWCFVVVLIYIFPVTSDVEHLLIYLLTICISSLEKCVFKSFAYFYFFQCEIFNLKVLTLQYIK